MARIISALLLAVATTWVGAQEPPKDPLKDAPKLAANAPERHIVVPGDTLWGIASTFLKDPWRWPDVWRLNREDIKNPHRIYPGDIIIVDQSSGSLRLRLGKPVKPRTLATQSLSPQIHSESGEKAIPSIPSKAITPFISRPLVIEPGAMDNAARIVATQEDRVFLATGDQAFVRGLGSNPAESWQIYRPGKPLKDPETGQILGHEAFYLGSARLVRPETTELPGIVRITSFKEEIGRGDQLIPSPPASLEAYVPHKPEQAVDARVMSVYGGVNEAGKYSVVTLNQGQQQGLEIGHVLAVSRKRTSQDYNDEGKRESTVLPDERYALIFVFRVFQKVSYALIMETSKPVIVGDAVRNP